MYVTPFTAYLSVTRLSGGALQLNSSKTAWNFITPFYRMGTDSLRMVYVIFHKSIYLRDISMRRRQGGVVRGVFVAELLRDGLDFPNAILQNEYRQVEDGLWIFSQTYLPQELFYTHFFIFQSMLQLATSAPSILSTILLCILGVHQIIYIISCSFFSFFDEI